MSRNATEVWRRTAENMAAELNEQEFCPGEKSGCPETATDCQECILQYFAKISQMEIDAEKRRAGC